MDQSNNSTSQEELESKLSRLRGREVEDKYKKMAESYGLPFLDLNKTPISFEALSLVDEKEARESGIAVIAQRGSFIVVAVLEPDSPKVLKIIESLTARKFKIKIVLATPGGLELAWSRYNQGVKTVTFDIGSIQIDESTIESLKDQVKNLSDVKSKIQNLSITKYLEMIIAGSLKLGASDIHFEPLDNSVSVRYRIDGILNQVTDIHMDYYEKITNRIKIVSKLKINIHSKPQDGRFTIKESGYEVEVRVSILPSEFGETIVMRILDPRAIKQSLEELGMRKDLLVMIKEQITKPHGAVVTTGPTGSGKTTALYAFLNYINSPAIKIITIEDPIEYHLKGISQTQVDTDRGYTFSNGLRSIIRQDPNVILVGEIRDHETADIAINASLTGHLVFTTLHTNDSAGAIPRLMELGIQPDLIPASVNLVMAQRLVRVLCQNCKKKKVVDQDELKRIQIALEPIKTRLNLPNLDSSLQIYEPGKCEHCSNSGYKGRVGVFEAFTISSEMEKLVARSATMTEIKDLTIKEGLVTLLQDAYLKLLEGLTSIEEIDRVAE